MLWIHGGDYQWGGANDRENGAFGSAYASNVIVVVINYRLGVFGFLRIQISALQGRSGEQYRQLRFSGSKNGDEMGT